DDATSCALKLFLTLILTIGRIRFHLLTIVVISRSDLASSSCCKRVTWSTWRRCTVKRASCE
ncbi:hypothetical protein COCCADRAFT_113110, partial [Bipolaris zeicola 26-R-13]